jgi:hypothetical protein
MEMASGVIAGISFAMYYIQHSILIIDPLIPELPGNAVKFPSIFLW